MSKLQEIKNEVATEYGYPSLNTMIWKEAKVVRIELAITEVARRYATEVARHNLERAANEAEVLYRGHSFGDYVVDKQSITSIEIELI